MPSTADDDDKMNAVVELIYGIDNSLSSIFFDGQDFLGRGVNWWNYQFYAIRHPTYFDSMNFGENLKAFYQRVAAWHRMREGPDK